jgi:hypothetical protein
VAWDGAGNDLPISTMGRCVPRAPGLPKVWPTSVGASVRFLTLRWIFYRRMFGDGPSRPAAVPGARIGERSSQGQIQPKTYEEGRIQEIVLIVGVLSPKRREANCGRREISARAKRGAAGSAAQAARCRNLRRGNSMTASSLNGERRVNLSQCAEYR